MNTPVIEARGVAARYGKKHVLEDFDLEVPAGSVTALVGANGAGKSTLMRILAAEQRATKGHVRVLGLEPRKKARALKRRIGWVPDRVELPRPSLRSGPPSCDRPHHWCNPASLRTPTGSAVP